MPDPTPPTSGAHAVSGYVAVTPDFLRAFQGASFAVDRIVLRTRATQQPYIVAPHPGAPAGTLPTWGLQAPDGSVPCLSLSLDTFRVLEAATAQPDGSLVLTSDVVRADATLKVGTVGRLVARAGAAVFFVVPTPSAQVPAPLQQPAPIVEQEPHEPAHDATESP